MSNGPTKADLAAQIEALTQSLADQRKAAEAWRDHKMPDPEAEAISACVKALDKLPTSRSSSWPARGGDHRRVLRYLAERYGVQWYDSPTVPFTGEGAL